MEKENYQKILREDFKEKVELIKDKVNILHFSTGADSVASYLRLKENCIEPILIYKYYIPHLKMVDNYIDYFQNKFGVRIYQFAHPLFAQAIGNLHYQNAMKKGKMIKLYNHYNLQCAEVFGRDKILFDKCLEDIFGSQAIYHMGLRYTDGINRFRMLRKYGVYHNNRFYPIADFKIGDIKDILKRHNCKLPLEYGLWGISFESPRAWNLGFIKEHCKETYKQILEYFPNANLLMYRENYNKLNIHFKRRLGHFSEFALRKEEYAIW